MKTATCPRTYDAIARELDSLQKDLGLLRYDDTNASQCYRLGEAQHLVVRARALVLSVREEPDVPPCTCFTGLCTACLARALESTEETTHLPECGATGVQKIPCELPAGHSGMHRASSARKSGRPLP